MIQPKGDAKSQEYREARSAYILAMVRDGMSFRKIGQVLGISGGRVSQLAKRAYGESVLAEKAAGLPPGDPESTLVIYNGLSVRIRNCLKLDGIHDLRQLDGMDREKLLYTPNFGKKSLRELEAAMARHGLALTGEAP